MIKLICQINTFTVSVAFFLVLAFAIFVLLSPFLSQHLPAEFVATPEIIGISVASIIFFTVFVGGFAAILRCVQLLETIEKRTRSMGSIGQLLGGDEIEAFKNRERLGARSEPQLKSR
ncbi:hypothetical protein EOI86_03840 [Hwanghaeella grinnelliae]|uniref:Uncharacterized protein n=1 Tax=Hwanghaeella grinnelliae TaxID=2500179 RepID=A0A437QV76_9PROT|nr:hypothetical protein [Hwanghaeella grinnelliae]RVU38427.1 hypothetical protein EOI86_03840 [Hwanghaeella grinnelliae]